MASLSGKRRLVVFIAGALAILVAAYWLAMPSKVESDQRQIEMRIDALVDAYNDKDWALMAQSIWNPAGEEATLNALNGYRIYPRVNTPVEIRNVKVEGTRGEAEIHVKWHHLLMDGDRTIKLVFIKTQTGWLLDLPATPGLPNP